MQSPFPLLLINDDAEYAALVAEKAAKQRLLVSWVKSLEEGLYILDVKKTIFGVVLDDKGMIEQNGEITEVFAAKAITEIRKIRPDITVTCIATEYYPIYRTYAGFNIMVFDRKENHIEPMLTYMKQAIEKMPVAKIMTKHAEIIAIFEEIFQQPMLDVDQNHNHHLSSLLKILQTAGSRNRTEIYGNLKDIRGLLEEYINILYCLKSRTAHQVEVSFHEKIYSFTQENIHDVYKAMIKNLFKFLSKCAVHKDPDFKNVPVNGYVHKRCINEFFEILIYLHRNAYAPLMKNDRYTTGNSSISDVQECSKKSEN